MSSFKIVVIGDAQIGKSSLFFRFVHHRFPNLPNTTIGGSFYCKKTDNGMVINMWDTAGQERFRSMIPMYLKNVNLVLFVYDITDRQTFDNLKQYWVDFVKGHFKKDVKNTKDALPKSSQTKESEIKSKPDDADNIEASGIINENEDDYNFYQAILVGNKCDLKDLRKVESKEGEELAESLGIPFVETSALTGKNVDKLWKMIQTKLLKLEVVEEEQEDTGLIVNLLKNAGENIGDKFSGCKC